MSVEVALNNGVRMPMMGLGTYGLGRIQGKIDPGRARWLICSALDQGYRLFDTSVVYQTEKILGEVLSDEYLTETGDPEEISGPYPERPFVITKISNQQQKRDAMAGIRASLQALKVPSLDLCLIHWPVPQWFERTWKLLEKAYEDGLCRAIGVSNFHIHHLETLLGFAKVIPTVNQVEMHPMLPQTELREFCRKHQIHVQAYSPLGRGAPVLLEHPRVQEIARELGRTPGQVLLRWVLDQGCSVLTRSSCGYRIAANRKLDFPLEAQHQKVLNTMDVQQRFGYDSDSCDFNQL